MIYQIYYKAKDENHNTKDYTIFDIEYYQQPCADTDKWYSEIICSPLIEGIAHYVKDVMLYERFMFDTFIKDATEIQELRGLLYEHYDNKPKSKEKSWDFHYNIFGNVLREKIVQFAEKYRLYINVD